MLKTDEDLEEERVRTEESFLCQNVVASWHGAGAGTGAGEV